jgi:acetyltransferase-like isoleucine patch superfamily enzyme
MVAGERYRADDPELVRERVRARRLTQRLAASDPGDEAGRSALLAELFEHAGEGSVVEAPFPCDYGWNTTLGERVYVNAHCSFLDCARIEVGALTMLGPAVQLCAATHPVDPGERETGLELALPIVLGRNVWLGAGVIVGAGVTIGDGSVVGAGSVVLRDVPPGVLAAGAPCRVLREL